MSNNTGYCCGQIPVRKPNKNIENMPENPFIELGVEVIYFGSGDIKIDHLKSGNVYYASNFRRRIKISTEDISELLKNPDFMITP
jgi:hypothetical protein